MSPRQKRPTEVVDMAKLMSAQGVEPLLLSQVAGPGHPRRFRVLPLEEAVLGRDDDCRITLDDEPVSREHAKVLYADYQPELLDLGSTNGTFLNGKKIHRAFLKNGDEIQVGASVFAVLIGKEYLEPEQEAGDKMTAGRFQSLLDKMKGKGVSAPGQSSAMSGRLSEIHLTSLLQIIQSDRATGTLVVLQGGQEGKLHIHHGEIRHATLGHTTGPKALYRIMALQEGLFEFFIPGRSPEYDTIEGDLQQHLLEAVQQKDELEIYKRQLPPPETRLAFNPAKLIVPSKVPTGVFEVMASVAQCRSVGEIIDVCRLPDFEVCRVLMVLLKHGIVEEAKGS
jgi:hypothetical protein